VADGSRERARTVPRTASAGQVILNPRGSSFDHDDAVPEPAFDVHALREKAALPLRHVVVDEDWKSATSSNRIEPTRHARTDVKHVFFRVDTQRNQLHGKTGARANLHHHGCASMLSLRSDSDRVQRAQCTDSESNTDLRVTSLRTTRWVVL
jgi:hypothetical protein